MAERIKYEKGDVVGNCEYIREITVEIKWGRKRRCAIFKCGLCGKEFTSVIDSIKTGNTSSCGCLKIDHPNRTTHGLRYTKEYHTWRGIKDRCLNPNDTAYIHYGGRGITICDEWKNDPEAFCNYVSKLEFFGEPGYTIDRIKNNKNYEPGNLQWTTQHYQVINSRPKESKTGYTGIHPYGKKYVAQITVHGITYKIGVSPTIKGAAMLRDMYIIKNGLWEYPLQVVRST